VNRSEPAAGDTLIEVTRTQTRPPSPRRQPLAARLQCKRLFSLHIFSLPHKPRPAPQYHKIQRCHGQVLQKREPRRPSCRLCDRL